MKIAFALDDSLDYPDGVQQYILTLGAWYEKAGHEVHYIVSTTQRRDLKHIHVLAKNISLTFNGNGVRTPRPVSRRRIDQFFSDNHFDVVHAQLPCSPFFVGRLLQQAPAHIRRVGTFHIAPFGRWSAASARIHGWTIRSALRELDAVCSVSPTAQKFASEAFRLQSQVVPNAVDLSQFRQAHKTSSASGNSTRIVFLGRLVERKGCLVLLRALLRLIEDPSFSHPIEVRIGGRGEQKQQLENFVAAHGIGDYVHFDDFIEEDEKATYLAQADIAVFPSSGGESFGIILVEAMATHGPVVVAGDNPGYRGVLAAHEDHLFAPKDEHALATLLRRYIEDPTLRDTRIEWQTQQIAQFDVDRVAPQLLALYQNSTD